MPELPEVQALAESLDRRLRGRCIASLTVVSIAALKTYDPPVTALAGRAVAGVGRHGKFLDLEAAAPGGTGPSLHLVAHLSRGGWVRWRENASDTRLAERGPLAARLRFDDGTGLDVTEQGTEKRLALYVVRDPAEVPGVGRLGVDALDPRLDARRLGGAAAQPSGNAQERARRSGSHRGGGQRLLRRDPARRPPLPRPGRAARRRRPRAAADGAPRDARRRPGAGPGPRHRAGSRMPSAPGCGCTAGPGKPAPSAATRCAKCRWRRAPSSTARGARPGRRPIRDCDLDAGHHQSLRIGDRAHDPCGRLLCDCCCQ